MKIIVSNLTCVLAVFLVALSIATGTNVADAAYADDFYVIWAPQNVRSINNDSVWQLVLDTSNASGIASKNNYLFGSFSMFLQLVPGDSAGTVTAFYFSSETTYWDEVDFEFLGNVSDQPYILQTNVFWNGTGGREQRIYLWFDPTTSFHNYTFLWNPRQILIMVDGVPIRVVPNYEARGIPFLSKQPLKAFGSIWDGSNWATRGGLVKLNWTDAPFITSFGKYQFDGCPLLSTPGCPTSKWWNTPQFQSLSYHQQNQLRWVTRNYMVYNYCTDKKRYPTPPPECP